MKSYCIVKDFGSKKVLQIWRIPFHSQKFFQARHAPLATRAWFLEIALVRTSVCMCVSAHEGINNQWRDIGHV